MKIALAQTNPVIADIKGNLAKLVSFIGRARSAGAEIVVFPEMATIGHPPMDLLGNRRLIDENLAAIEDLAAACAGIAAICGYVDYDKENGPMLFNSAALLAGGRVLASRHKACIPPGDAYSGSGYFSPGKNRKPVEYGGRNIGLLFGGDIWSGSDGGGILHAAADYPLDPAKQLVDEGADLIVCIDASPYARGKNSKKWGMISALARGNAVPIVYVNQVGGFDSLIFDGNSFAVDARGAFLARAAGFEEDLVLVDDSLSGAGQLSGEEELEDIRMALVLGIRDYAAKSGFKGAILGLSGGLDSAVTAALAVEALGRDNVLGVTMPSPVSTKGSVDDSIRLAENLGIRIEAIRIDEIYNLYRKKLSDIFTGTREDETEENIQARIRGNLLMAMSNKFGGLVLTTGNKSELGLGIARCTEICRGGLRCSPICPRPWCTAWRGTSIETASSSRERASRRRRRRNFAKTRRTRTAFRLTRYWTESSSAI